MHILWSAVVLVLLLLGFCFISYITLLVVVTLYSIRLQASLPLFKWLTLDEIVAMGYSWLLSSLCLILLHKSGLLEARIRNDTIEVTDSALAVQQLDDAINEGDQNFGKGWTVDLILSDSPNTVEIFEFRLITRGRGKKKFRLLIIKPQLLWSPTPVRSPA